MSEPVCGMVLFDTDTGKPVAQFQASTPELAIELADKWIRRAAMIAALDALAAVPASTTDVTP